MAACLLPLGLQVHSLKLALEGVEKERDFYFGKLREIELLCQEQGQESDSLVQRLMEVLYASDEHVSGGARWGRTGLGRTPRSQGPCGPQRDRRRVLRPTLRAVALARPGGLGGGGWVWGGGVEGDFD